MKKLWILSLAVLMATALAAPAQAAINGTAHANTITRAGQDVAGCGQCHLPHAGQGNRLWPVTPGTSGEFVGNVAPLCGYCHHSSGGALILGGQQNLLWDAASHGAQMLWTDDSNGYVHSITQSQLPYTNAGNGRTSTFIECTSCHNVHDDTNRPFLQTDLEGLCARCHMDRHYVGGALQEGAAPVPGAWGAANVGTGNPGSHPVGSDITGDNFGGLSPIGIPTYMSFADGGTRAWSLGGKLNDISPTGGVQCFTCHAVHGTDRDIDDLTSVSIIVAGGPYTNFLAREQNAPGDAGRGDGRSVANGNGMYNGLCEACHVGTQVDSLAYLNANADYDSTTDLGEVSQNPGGTAFGHPVDNMDAEDPNWVTSFAANWPSGNTAAAGLTAAIIPASPVPICESCHAPHPWADAGQADLINITTNADTEYILRATSSGVCEDCHGTAGSATNHHPVGRTFQGNNLGYLGFSTGDNILECGTCHGGSGKGVHNWAGVSQLEMRTGWKPSDNARAATYDPQMGITCMDCHYQLTGAHSLSPTLADGIPGEPNFVVIGNASHYIGSITAGAAYWTAMGAAQDPYTWAGWNGDGAFSRFGGTSANPVLVCESCHELQPSMNAGINHLLLTAFEEELAEGRNPLCENCHYPSGTHPITGVTVTRTDAILSTSTAATWVTSPIDTNIILRPSPPNELNCDTCHQVHDANSQSWSFILDTADANVSAPAIFAAKPIQSTAGSYTAAYVSTIAVSPGGDTTAFCNECHPYQ